MYDVLLKDIFGIVHHCVLFQCIREYVYFPEEKYLFLNLVSGSVPRILSEDIDDIQAARSELLN